MIPENADDLHVLAGEYVLGVLDEADASEVAGALSTNTELRRAVTFWEEQLHPLSELAPPAEPPPGTWEKIEARITKPAPGPAAPRFWDNIALWRWSTAGFAAAAAASIALWIVMTLASGPSFVAVLHPPQQDQAGWVATASRSGLVVRAVTTATPPTDRSFELWAITPGSTRPRSLGVIPPTGELKLYPLPPDLRDGATLAISIEPIGGSPTHQPTGPVVFVGSVKAV
jgi:anti-sigma-K factor RskA